MHVLKDGDEIALGHFNLRFEDDAANSSDMEKTQVLGGVASARQDESFRKVDDVPEYAILTFIKGPHAGEVKRIEGSLYTIGRPGGDVAVVARRPQGFFLLHIGGNSNPMINGTEVTSTRGIQLNEGDIIQVGEIEAELQFE
jgi:predicted component of type VI protein secretion system